MSKFEIRFWAEMCRAFAGFALRCENYVEGVKVDDLYYDRIQVLKNCLDPASKHEVRHLIVRMYNLRGTNLPENLTWSRFSELAFELERLANLN